jgi:CubicO group peptidase (beta-lactamase class C family)
MGWTIIGVFLSCCTKEPSPKSTQNQISFKVSNSYEVPYFANDHRITTIQKLSDSLHAIFEQHSKEKHIPGISYGIVVDDSLVLSGNIGVINIDGNIPVTTQSLFRIASMTKSFTAMAILKLRDEGLLSLQDQVTDYIPELQSLIYLTNDAPAINIQNLLNMTAGFPEDNPWGDRQLALSDQDFTDLISQGFSTSNIPSYQFEYSNTGYALLGRIISVVSGISYQEYINQHIFKPLGMNQTYWEYSDLPDDQFVTGYRWEDDQWKLEPILHDGAYGSMGGLITSIEDFKKYVGYQLSAWPPRSETTWGPVNRSTLREMQTPQFNFLDYRDTDWNDEPCASMIGYGYGLSISMNCKRIKRVSHGGALPGYGSGYAFFPDYGIGIMAFGNLTYTSPVPYENIERLLFETAGIEPRELPASEILKQRQQQLVSLFQTTDLSLDSEIFAENFFLDRSKKKRIQIIQQVLDQAGTIQHVDQLNPRNQLRGDFDIECQHGNIRVFFTLTPEKDPKIQRLDVSFEENRE